MQMKLKTLTLSFCSVVAVSLVLKVFLAPHINKDLALLSRNNCQQLDEVELDIVVLSQLQALRTHPDQPLHERRQSADLFSLRFIPSWMCFYKGIFGHC